MQWYILLGVQAEVTPLVQNLALLLFETMQLHQWLVMEMAVHQKKSPVHINPKTTKFTFKDSGNIDVHVSKPYEEANIMYLVKCEDLPTFLLHSFGIPVGSLATDLRASCH